jgi:hypothetical protein
MFVTSAFSLWFRRFFAIAPWAVPLAAHLGTWDSGTAAAVGGRSLPAGVSLSRGTLSRGTWA